MVISSDYSEQAVKAARSVMMELIHILGEYREDIAIIGGWVPELLCPGSPEKHIGTLDVDLAINHLTVDDEGYRTIKELLINHGYVEGKQPFQFLRKVGEGENPITVQVDILAGEYKGTEKQHRHQKIQNIQPRKARGCDLVFQHIIKLKIEGILPDGSLDIVEIPLASIVPFMVMKAMALAGRIKAKDAYDIYFCLKWYPGGTDAVAAEFIPLMEQGLVNEALIYIKDKFASPDHIGPKQIADFLELDGDDERAIKKRDAYETVDYFLKRLGIR